MKYESIFVAQPRMTEDDFEALRQSFEEVIRTQGGTVDRSESWGKRRLAYRVQKHEEAFYGFYLYDANGEVVQELERRFRLHEGVIKFLSVQAPPEGVKIAGSADLRPRPPEPAPEPGEGAIPPAGAPAGVAPAAMAPEGDPSAPGAPAEAGTAPTPAAAEPVIEPAPLATDPGPADGGDDADGPDDAASPGAPEVKE